MNTHTLQISLEVDDNGSVKIRRLGEDGERTAKKMDRGFKDVGVSVDDVDRKSQGLLGTIGDFGTTAVPGFGMIASAAAAASAAIGALVITSGKEAREMENLARLAGSTSEELRAIAFATEEYGKTAEDVADISKDFHDKLGDFVATGGGEFADFWEQIAPKIGITAQELQNLSGPDALIAVKKAMDDANISYEEQVFYLESVANDVTKLIPLLEDGGAALKEKAARAKELGVALSEVDNQKLIEADEAARELTGAFTGAKNELAAEFAPVVTEVLGLTTDLILEVKDEALAFAKVIVNIADSFKGWGAVADGRLSFFEFATMDAEELATWLQKDKVGVGELAKQIAELEAKRKDVAESFAFSKSARSEKASTLAGLDKDINALKQQKAIAENLAAVISEDYTDAWSGVKTEIDSTTNAVDNNRKSVADAKATMKDYANEGKALGEDMWLIHARGADEARMRGIQALGEIAEEAVAAGEAMGEDMWLKQAEGMESANTRAMEMLDEQALKAEETAASIQESLGYTMGSYLVEQFGVVDGAWGQLWDSMLMKMGQVLSEMMVSWAASEISQLFEGWGSAVKFHTGLWSLADDELPAVLQKGEMVIPADAAADIRENLMGLGAGSFDGLVAATEHANAGNWNGPFMTGLADSFLTDIKAGVASMIFGDASPGQVVANIANPQNVLGNIGYATVEWAKQKNGLWGSYSDTGAFLGAGAATMGLGGTMQPYASQMASYAGAWLGDRIGDMLNDREFEVARDAMEAGYLSKEEAWRLIDQKMTSTGGSFAGGSTLGGFFESINDFFSDTFDTIVEFITPSTTTDESWYDPTATSPLEDYFSGFGGSDSNGSSGGGGTYNSDGGMTGNWEGAPALKDGGVIDRLIVPHGEDGFVAVQAGEGVAKRDTMALLDSALRSDGNGEIKRLLTDLFAANISIIKQLQDLNKRMTKWDKIGMPAARTA